jgi:pilus assembly protein Flp/PilA
VSGSLPRTLVTLQKEESGQDLVEYALVLAMIALAAVAGMSSLATSINTLFSNVASILGQYIS